jgi:hypothetical protein
VDGGRTFFRRPFAAFSMQTRYHEVIHARSRPFIQQAVGAVFQRRAGDDWQPVRFTRGMTRLMESLTDYFAYTSPSGPTAPATAR